MSTEAVDRFNALSRDKKYAEQAVWFLNGFWSEVSI
jgi:hypothetical protein